MRGRKFWLLVIALCSGHLILVGLGAAHVRLERFGFLGSLVDTYSALSGAASSYGFFAPGIGTDLKTSFEGKARNGRDFVDSMESHGGRELALRVGNIVRVFGDEVSDLKVRRALAASWAGKMLARHDDAQAITVRIETYELPPMQAFARGAEPHWAPFYAATFRVISDSGGVAR